MTAYDAMGFIEELRSPIRRHQRLAPGTLEERS